MTFQAVNRTLCDVQAVSTTHSGNSGISVVAFEGQESIRILPPPSAPLAGGLGSQQHAAGGSRAGAGAGAGLEAGEGNMEGIEEDGEQGQVTPVGSSWRPTQPKMRSIAVQTDFGEASQCPKEGSASVGRVAGAKRLRPSVSSPEMQED